MKPILALICALAIACLCVGGLAEQTLTIVTLGRYEQDNNPDNGPEPIEWIVLGQWDNRALVLSRHCLDARTYNSAMKSATWETCTIRQWLNKDFLEAAFTEEERKLIIPERVYNNMLYGYPGMPVDGGEDTVDRIFLLSYKELLDFSGSVTIPSATAYAMAQTEYGAASWWLRSPGPDRVSALYVSEAGGLDFCISSDFDRGIRPAMYMRLEKES